MKRPAKKLQICALLVVNACFMAFLLPTAASFEGAV
jgi:hypothetical protein